MTDSAKSLGFRINHSLGKKKTVERKNFQPDSHCLFTGLCMDVGIRFQHLDERKQSYGVLLPYGYFRMGTGI